VEYLVSLTLLSDVLAAAIGGRGDDVIDYGEDGDGTAGCGRSVALLPSGMDSELSLESGGGEQIYAHDPDAELLAKYNLDLSTRVWSVTASGGVPYVTHQPGTWVPANFGDKAYRRDTGAEEWDITGSITAIAAQTQDVRHFWVTSGGAASWSSENANISTAHLNDIATDGAGNWGAVGSSGYLSYSTDDGATWTGTQVFSTNTMRGIAYGNGYWVAVGTTNTAYRLYTATSLSGSWTSRTISGLNANADDSLTSVAYGNSIWVAVGDGHAPGVYAIATTGSDPTTGWTARTVTDAAGHTQADPTFGPDMDVAYGNGRFVVVGGDDIATSTNGTTWTNYGEIANGGGDDGGVLSSMVSVTYGAGVWLVSGSSNSTVVSGNPVTGVMYNDDVTDMFGWTGINPFSGSAPYDIEYGDQFMAIVGDGTIFASATGTSGWANDDSSFFTATPFFPFEFTGGIAYGDGVWAAGGDTADAGPLIVRTGGPVLQVRDSEDGSLITETSLSSEGTSMRRSASGQFAMVQQGSNTLLRFNRSAVLQDTVTITGFFDPNNKDWAVDDAYYVYKLGSNTLVRYDPSGVQLWSANLNSRHDYRFPSLVTTGNGNQVVVTDFVRVVGYIGEADWDDDPSEAVLLTIAKTTGDTKIIQRFGGDADDSAQAEAVHHHASGCVYIAGAAVGTEFEGESLSGTRGWILRVGQDNITDTAGESIYGVVFPSLSSDPASGDSTDGQVYYNTTTDKLRVRANGTWVDLH
jgi:hypothetical protein